MKIADLLQDRRVQIGVGAVVVLVALAIVLKGRRRRGHLATVHPISPAVAAQMPGAPAPAPMAPASGDGITPAGVNPLADFAASKGVIT